MDLLLVAANGLVTSFLHDDVGAELYPDGIARFADLKSECRFTESPVHRTRREDKQVTAILFGAPVTELSRERGEV